MRYCRLYWPSCAIPAPMPPADLHDRLDAALNRLPEAIRNARIDFPRGSVAKDLAAEAAFLDKLSRHTPR